MGLYCSLCEYVMYCYLACHKLLAFNLLWIDSWHFFVVEIKPLFIPQFHLRKMAQARSTFAWTVQIGAHSQHSIRKMTATRPTQNLLIFDHIQTRSLGLVSWNRLDLLRNPEVWIITSLHPTFSPEEDDYDFLVQLPIQSLAPFGTVTIIKATFLTFTWTRTTGKPIQVPLRWPQLVQALYGYTAGSTHNWYVNSAHSVLCICSSVFILEKSPCSLTTIAGKRTCTLTCNNSYQCHTKTVSLWDYDFLVQLPIQSLAPFGTVTIIKATFLTLQHYLNQITRAALLPHSTPNDTVTAPKRSVPLSNIWNAVSTPNDTKEDGLSTSTQLTWFIIPP